MAKTTTISTMNVTTVDIQTVFYNRGTVAVTPPYGASALAASGSRVLPGNALNCSKISRGILNGNTINSIHDNQVFVSVSGLRWRQYRTLAASGNYAINPRFDCESDFIMQAGGDTDVTLDLGDTTLLPGMTFRFKRPVSAGNLIITFSNGTVMNPSSGATGTIITVTQYGFVDIRIITGVLASGPKVLIEGSVNATVS